MRLPFVLWKFLSVVLPRRTPHHFKLYCIPTVKLMYSTEQIQFWSLEESVLARRVRYINGQNRDAVFAVYNAMPDSFPRAFQASSLVAHTLNTNVYGHLSPEVIDGLRWSGLRYTSSFANSLRRLAVKQGVTVVIIVMEPNEVNLLLDNPLYAHNPGIAEFSASSGREGAELKLIPIPTM
jgi:hypothetical protein